MCYEFFVLIDESFRNIAAVALCIVGFVAAISNVLSIIVTCRLTLRTPSNKIILSLAFSDCGVAFIVIPVMVWMVKNAWHRDTISCVIESIHLVSSVWMVGPFLWTIALLAYDRYVLLTKYSSYDSIMTNKKLSTYIASFWISMFALGLGTVYSEFVLVATTFFNLCTPFILLVGCYVLIMRSVRESRRNLERHEVNTQIQQRREIKLALKVAVMIVIYLLCLMPTLIWLILHQVSASFAPGFLSDEMNSKLQVVALTAGCSNSCVNSFIYISQDPGFRREFKKLLFRRQPQIHTANARNVRVKETEMAKATPIVRYGTSSTGENNNNNNNNNIFVVSLNYLE